MENIIIAPKGQKRIQSLIDNKDELIKKLQEEAQKQYNAKIKEIEQKFNDTLETYVLSLIDQLTEEDDNREYILSKEQDEFVLIPKENNNGDIQHDSNES